MDHNRIVGVVSTLCAALLAWHVASARAVEPPASTTRPPNAVSLSIDTSRDKGETMLQISWAGQPSTAILVITIASLEDLMGRSRVILGELQELPGIVFVRRISRVGRCTLKLSAAAVNEHFQDGRVLVLLHIVDRVSVDILETTSTKSRKVMESKRITPNDCSSTLQVLTGSDSWEARAFPALQPMVFETPERASIMPTVTWVDSWSSLRLHLTLDRAKTGAEADR